VLAGARVAPAGRGLKLSFARGATVDVFRESQGRRVLRERRVAHFTRARTWKGKGAGDGYYLVRFRAGRDFKRIVLRRSHGRWARRPDFYGRLGCSTLRSFKLLRPVFGGTTHRALGISVQLNAPARVQVTVKRGSRVVKRYPAVQQPAGRTLRRTLSSRGLAVGDYRVTIDVRRGRERIVETLTSRRL
jgi:hypothetical protein